MPTLRIRADKGKMKVNDAQAKRKRTDGESTNLDAFELWHFLKNCLTKHFFPKFVTYMVITSYLLN